MTFKPGPNYALNDTFLRARLQEVINERDIQVVVETGLNDGQSTVEFSRMAPKVIGVDHDLDCIDMTRRRFHDSGRTNFELILGHSPSVLAAIMPRLPVENTMFMLDAHWECVSPIFDEIRSIPRGRGVLIFHDIECPGKDFGFDGVLLIDGTIKDLTYDLIRKDLTDWSPAHRVEYMQQANGCYRGACIVYPS